MGFKPVPRIYLIYHEIFRFPEIVSPFIKRLKFIMKIFPKKVKGVRKKRWDFMCFNVQFIVRKFRVNCFFCDPWDGGPVVSMAFVPIFHEMEHFPALAVGKMKL